ncbi:MAG: glycosyltransferase [Candidatus Marinimicrobia bacterium]|nr:glycosyltransferase [Candidatus Neomarinimicrobiota bacterium]
MKNGINSIVIDQNTSNHCAKSLDQRIIYLKGNRSQKYIQLLNLLSSSNADVCHFHTSLFKIFIKGGFFLLFNLINVQTVLTIHSGHFVKQYEKKSLIWQIAVKKMINSFNHVIALNKEQLDFYLNRLQRQQTNVTLIPPFIFPSDFNKSAIKSMTKINSFKANVDMTILVSGRIFLLYGFDLIIQAANKVMCMRNIKIGLIFIFYTAEDKKYRIKLMKKISNYEYHLVLRDLSSEQFLSVMKNCNIYVRPTYYDGNSVSTMEAIALNIPVIASDIDGRPKGAILFKTGDVPDLVTKLCYCIDNYSLVKNNLRHYKLADNGAKMLTLYQKIANHN